MGSPVGVALLGSTGSIGGSTLRVLARHREEFRPVALVAGSNREGLEAQVREWQPAFAGMACARDHNGFPSGPEVLIEAATRDDVDVVINAVVGAAGLDATLAALRAGKRVALANKETLVTAGELVMAAARAGGGELVPIDSEHSAVLQCLTAQGARPSRLILTASGGPFRTWERERLAVATVSEALNHPTWRMGAKVSVDSATLANKALEIIEARFLFDLSYDQLEVVVHPQSVVHAFVEFPDGSVLAQLGFPSMELPILYALTHPRRLPDAGVRRFDPLAAGPLTFEAVRTDCFPALGLGLEAGRAGGTATTAFNAANEIAVAGFLQGRITFGRIAEVIAEVMGRHRAAPLTDVGTVRDADRETRLLAEELL